VARARDLRPERARVWSSPRAGRAAARLAAVHATLVTGAAGMALSLMLLFSYQARWARSTRSSGAVGHVHAGARARRSLGGARPILLAAALAATASAAVIGLALALLGALGPPLTGLGPAHAVLLLLAGAGTGAVFPAAAGALLAAGRDTRRAAAAIELADHAGAALAALAAPLLLVPVLGLGASAGLVAGLCALGALGVGSARPARRGVGASRRTTPCLKRDQRRSANPSAVPAISSVPGWGGRGARCSGTALPSGRVPAPRPTRPTVSPSCPLRRS
jgi:hypothetical protein